MLRKVLSIVLFSIFFIGAFAQNGGNRTYPHSLYGRSHWVDSVFSTLDREAKIGQLFMVPVSTYCSTDEIDVLTSQLKDFSLGGVYITGGGPLSHARVLNLLQKNSKVPLLAGISAEWGLSQTLDSTMSFQKPMVASAWREDSLVTIWANQIALQMKMMGLHVNFAPNADNEVFFGDYLRYFSNDENRVGQRAVAFTKALQSENILSVAKHLPRNLPMTGSVKDSTLILHLDQIDTAGFVAFQRLIENGVDGILTNYLHFSLQNEKEIIPASLSQVFITEILRKKMKFNGLVFADVSNFNKSSRKMKAGDAELLAFETGNDILLNSNHFGAAIKKIYKRLKKDKLLQQQLDASVKKVLEAKFNAGLSHFHPIETDNLLRRLHSPEASLINHQLAEA